MSCNREKGACAGHVAGSGFQVIKEVFIAGNMTFSVVPLALRQLLNVMQCPGLIFPLGHYVSSSIEHGLLAQGVLFCYLTEG